MPNRSQRRAADLANPFGDVVRCGEKLIALLIQQQMEVAKVRPRNMPMEVLGLQIKGKHVRKRDVERTSNVSNRIWNRIRRRRERRGLQGCSTRLRQRCL